MCVTVAMLLPRDIKTGKPVKDAKWRIAKIRDRMYDPEYIVKRYTVKEHDAAQLFLVDGDTDWTEGVSVLKDDTYLSIVSSALNNSMDKKDGTKNVSTNDTVSNNGYIIRKALKQKNIELAVDVIREGKLDGCSLITDGNRLFVIECTLPLEVKEKYRNVKNNKRFEDIVPLEEYKTIIKEVKDDFLVVRTNHGVFDGSFGYQPSDGDSYTSSVKRREYAIGILEKEVYEPLDLITNLSKMGRDDIDKNSFFRPLRLKDGKNEVYTTTIVQMDPSGTMIVKPIECKFNINNLSNLIKNKYKTHMVILPHRSRMFESFKDYLNKIKG